MFSLCFFLSIRVFLLNGPCKNHRTFHKQNLPRFRHLKRIIFWCAQGPRWLLSSTGLVCKNWLIFSMACCGRKHVSKKKTEIKHLEPWAHKSRMHFSCLNLGKSCLSKLVGFFNGALQPKTPDYTHVERISVACVQAVKNGRTHHFFGKSWRTVHFSW